MIAWAEGITALVRDGPNVLSEEYRAIYDKPPDPVLR